MSTKHMQKFLQASQIIRYRCSKNKSGKITLKISHFRNTNPLVICYMSLDGEEFRLLFDVLFTNIWYTVSKVSPDH